MTKRFNNFEAKNYKKPKLEDDIEALWGEDLDEDVLDDCIKLATQVCEKEKITYTQLNNITILPTYNAFKERSAIVSSTQVNNCTRPSTSRYEPFHKKVTTDEDLQNEMKLLRQQYEEKEGEVTILRTQLQEIKMNIQNEQQKTQNEWKQKLTVADKQMKSVKSELEFKNLEIANLKQKILDITKHNNMDIMLNTTQNITIPKITKNKLQMENAEIIKKPATIQVILDPVYPLKGIIPNSIYNLSKREHYIIETKLIRTCRNAIPYLQNQTVTSFVAMDKNQVNVNFVFPEILKLINCTEKEINLDENVFNIKKIFCTCEQFLDDLQTLLNEIKNSLRTEDVLQADSNYLKYQDSECVDKDEIGQKSGILLNMLAQLYPYSDFLRKCICCDNYLSFQENELYIKKFPYLSGRKQNSRHHYFLNVLLNIVKTAGEIRKANIMASFFCSVIKLLTSIGKTRNYDHVSDIFCQLTKELVLARPTAKVIRQITYLLKVASNHSSFIEFLLNKSRNSISSKKGILYFNEDACRFYVFVMLFDNSIFKLKSECSLSICLNMLCFMNNTFKTSHWIHHQDTKECECVPQLHKLEIEIVFRALEQYLEEIKTTGRRTSDWNVFFKNAIAVNVLNLMTFNSYELTEKYITVLSQYKEIEKKLQKDDDLIELEKLNITEETIEISNNAFANVDF